MNATNIKELLSQLLTVPQAAERLQIGQRAVQTACQRGQLPGAILLGREWRIPPAAVESRLEKHGAGQIPQDKRPNKRRKSSDGKEIKNTGNSSRK